VWTARRSQFGAILDTNGNPASIQESYIGSYRCALFDPRQFWIRMKYVKLSCEIPLS